MVYIVRLDCLNKTYQIKRFRTFAPNRDRRFGKRHCFINHYHVTELMYHNFKKLQKRGKITFDSLYWLLPDVPF